VTRDELVQYWVGSSEKDYQAMESLFTNCHYVWALFVGHLERLPKRNRRNTPQL